jgi:hypothetical protein
MFAFTTGYVDVGLLSEDFLYALLFAEFCPLGGNNTK